MAIFNTVRHLGFSKCWYLIAWWRPEDRNASSCQMSSKSVKWFLRYRDFSIFKMLAVCHTGFVKMWKFYWLKGPEGRGAPLWHTSLKLVKQFLRYRDFSFFSRWRPTAISDFENVKILLANGIKRAEMHQFAKYRPHQPIRCGAIAILLFLRWRPSAILDLFGADLDQLLQ